MGRICAAGGFIEVINMKLQDIADETIALVVTVAGTAFAGWITYQTGQIPEFFAVGFGMILMHYFQKTHD